LRYTLDDTIWHRDWLDLAEAQTRAGKGSLVVGVSAFLATGHDQHGQVAEKDPDSIPPAHVTRRFWQAQVAILMVAWTGSTVAALASSSKLNMESCPSRAG